MIGGDLNISNEIEIPNAFICKITYEMFVDPVINDSGQTYERDAI